MDERFRKLYVQEARGCLEEINTSIQFLQKNASDKEALEILFGAIHTLKSTSFEMSFDRIGDLLHCIEELLSEVQVKTRLFDEGLVDINFELLTLLDQFIDLVEQGKEDDVNAEDLVTQVSRYKTEKPKSGDQPQSQLIAQPTGLDSYTKKIRQIRLDVDQIDKMVNLVGELVISKIKLSARIREYPNDAVLAESAKNLDILLQEMQSHVMSARLIPIDYIFSRFPRLAREVAHAQQKEVNLITEGSSIELDRTILDGLAEPLVHLIKNAIDHGIETAQARKRSGKHPIAQLTVTATRKHSYYVVEINDDGDGIDVDAVFARAGKESPADESQAMDQALEMILRPGFSTARSVTEISGRGVGLSFVKQRTENLGGRLSVVSQKRVGTTFQIRLPLTMAIIQSLLVDDPTGRYAIPLSAVAGAVEIPKSSVSQVESDLVIEFRGQTIRLMGLDDLLNSNHKLSWYQDMQPDEMISVVILKETDAIGIVVKKFLGKQEIVVKPLDRLTSRIPIFSGVTILEDGEPAFILDTSGLHNKQSKEIVYD